MLFASGALAGKAIGFLMLPILTRLMPPELLGRFDILATLGSALITILLLGSDTALARLYFDDRHRSIRTRLVASWFLLSGLIVVPAAVALVLLRAEVSSALVGDGGLAVGLAIVAIVLVFGTVQVLSLNVLRVQGRAASYGVLVTVGLLLNALLTLVFLLAWRRDEIGAITAQAVSWAFAALIGVLLVRSTLRQRPSVADMVALARFGIPLAPAVVALSLGEFGHRAILLASGGAEQVGYLSVALRFGSVAMLAVTGFQLAWQPRVFAAWSDRTAASPTTRQAHGMIAIVTAAAVAVAAAVPFLIGVLVGESYADASTASGLATLPVLAQAAFIGVSTPMLARGLTGRVAIGMVSGVALALAMSLLLSAAFGAIGIIWSMGAGVLLSTVALRISDRRGWGQPDPLRVSAPILVGAGSIVLLSVTSGPEFLPARVVAIGALVTILLITGQFRKLWVFGRAAIGHGRTE
jgi:O-antigen/teichoic acid export membrane protein